MNELCHNETAYVYIYIQHDIPCWATMVRMSHVCICVYIYIYIVHIHLYAYIYIYLIYNIHIYLCIGVDLYSVATASTRIPFARPYAFAAQEWSFSACLRARMLL